MDPVLIISENKIREAMENGEFDNLPGQGKPIDFSDGEDLPPEFQMVSRVLKNSGYADDEANIMKQVQSLKEEAKRLGSDPKAAAVSKFMKYKEAVLLALSYRRQKNKPDQTSE
jgi:hypothetical protein